MSIFGGRTDRRNVPSYDRLLPQAIQCGVQIKIQQRGMDNRHDGKSNFPRFLRESGIDVV
jgi:hypothetical protein